METVRPYVDRWLLETVSTRPFLANDFVETREGQCRLMPSLRRQLAETLPLWRDAVIPVITQVTNILRGQTITPLTETLRRPFSLPRICAQCGATVPTNRRVYCSDACKAQHQRDARRKTIKGLQHPIDTPQPNEPYHPRQRTGATPAASDADLAHYRAAILPGLAAVPLATIRRATGLSRSYCKRIRLGKVVPHPVHWPALVSLVAPPS